MIYSNQDGQIAFESSPSIADSERAIFTPDIQERFAELVSLRSPSLANLSVAARPVRPERSRGPCAYPSMAGRTRQRGSWSPICGSPTPLIPCDWQVGQNRRQRRGGGRRRELGLPYSSIAADFGGDALNLPSASGCVIRVDDEARLKKYYEKAFEGFQQLNCRVIAKAFIKLVEPRKQVNYPYNGRRASSSPGGERRADPEMTKPPWWPAGVTHKEPDHLLKAERIQLLIHILRELRESHDITAERLRDAGQDVRRSISPPERLQILDEVYSVRHMEERYLRGEIPGDVLVPIAQVHLSGPEFEGNDDSSMRSSEAPSSWGMDSSDGRSETAGTYDHLMPYSHSSSISSNNSNNNNNNNTSTSTSTSTSSHPPGSSSTRASSWDSSMPYSPREYPSSATSGVPSPHSVEVSPPNHHRPSFSSYLNQPMLASAPVTTGVMWNPALQAPAPPYHPPF
ncbi:hypothetical protein UA08_06737 [Talaromyces atroroseus]|uniref:Subtelomeric hrmA-associated cluster protein AFUB-079030/YDR124W-like helical bundle domain-containing protein n=1 Tax=Talaromyces atroroseus TaxID=1441469 RepID=A0A225AR12_TALAT|nr:hypothetical protein UA08_06737 [Talaromyces atroroseus]OKL58039.1 hypothetical protein UA08_06737 [Talaromyces atroroseus]